MVIVKFLKAIWADPLCRLIALMIAGAFIMNPLLQVLAWASVVVR